MPGNRQACDPSALRTCANLRPRKQVLPVLDNSVVTGAPLHTPDAIPNIPTTAPAGDSGDGLLHPVCPVDGGPHCDFDRVVGTDGEREWELQSLCGGAGKYRSEREYIGVFGAA